MASFCTKCGAALSGDTKFCTACGAPAPVGSVEAAAPAWSAPVSPLAPPPPPPGAYQPPPYQPAPYQSPAPPASSGTSALKIILIIVGVLVGLVLLGVAIFAFTVWRVAKSVHVDEKSGQVSVSTPGGTFSANADQNYTSGDLGTDVYPGAEKGHGGAKLDLPNVSMVSALYTTTDPKEKVIAFYKDKFGSGSSTMETDDGAMLTLTKSDKESVMVTVSQKASEDDGKTKIAIVHTKKK